MSADSPIPQTDETRPQAVKIPPFPLHFLGCPAAPSSVEKGACSCDDHAKARAPSRDIPDEDFRKLLDGLFDELQECDPDTPGDKEIRARIQFHVSRLQSERARLDEENERIRGEASGWQDIAEHAERELSRIQQTELTAEEARKDSERLDWLESRWSFSGKWYDESDGFNSETMQFSSDGEGGDYDSVRGAIDKLAGGAPK